MQILNFMATIWQNRIRKLRSAQAAQTAAPMAVGGCKMKYIPGNVLFRRTEIRIYHSLCLSHTLAQPLYEAHHFFICHPLHPQHESCCSPPLLQDSFSCTSFCPPCELLACRKDGGGEFIEALYTRVSYSI